MRKLALAVAALQLLAALPAAGAATQGGRRRADTLLPGAWGGRHVHLEVTEGGATVEFDCARATVEGRIAVDRSGRFSVAATYYQERGGPERADETPAGEPVRLNGRVGGSLMRLTVTRAGTRRVLGTYSLARDREPFIVKCR